MQNTQTAFDQDRISKTDHQLVSADSTEPNETAPQLSANEHVKHAGNFF